VINKRLKSFVDGEFTRHVLTLMTGTGLAQVIVLLLSPVITRLFEREHFATLEQFVMILTLGSVVVSGKYEQSIMLPKKQEDASQLTGLSFLIAAAACLVAVVLVAIFGDVLSSFYQNKELGQWLWLLPVSLFFYAVFNILNYWFSRLKLYRRAAWSKVTFSLSSEPVKLCLGWAGNLSGGLIIGVVVGRVVSGLAMLIQFLRDDTQVWRTWNKKEMFALGAEYKVYPRYVMLGSLMNRTAQWAHVALFSAFFGLYSIAFFALARRLVLSPLTLISGSFSQVFYQKISTIENRRELRRVYFKNLKVLTAMGLAMIGVLFLLPENSMGVIFGKDWTETLTYLRILSFWYVMNFITGSLGFIWHRLSRQKLIFWFDAFHLIIVLLAIFIGYYVGCDEMLTLKLFVAAKCLYLGFNIIASIVIINRLQHVSK
jgi:O-antigen/teichoic acid export membrane protein